MDTKNVLDSIDPRISGATLFRFIDTYIKFRGTEDVVKSFFDDGRDDKRRVCCYEELSIRK